MNSMIVNSGLCLGEMPSLRNTLPMSRPFTTHHNALNRDLYLRISVELFLNRCIVGGLENVYDMGKVFRNEGISPKHSPEFTIIEFMMAYADYNDVATATEEMFAFVAQR